MEGPVQCWTEVDARYETARIIHHDEIPALKAQGRHFEAAQLNAYTADRLTATQRARLTHEMALLSAVDDPDAQRVYAEQRRLRANGRYQEAARNVSGGCWR